VAVQNIHSLVTVVLDVSSGDCTRWRDQFLLTLGKYSLQGHVLFDNPPEAAAHPDWARIDCVVKSWLYGTLSTELANTVMDRGCTARAAWLAVETQFLGNRETRALHLDARFRNFVQGDLSISEYCRRLKGMAADLGDLGEVVSDRTLILNLLRGLNDCYAAIALHLRRGRPFPIFMDARADLLLEEINLANRPSALQRGR